MKLNEIAVKNEDGEIAMVPTKDFIANYVKEKEVKDFESDSMGTQEAKKVVQHIITQTAAGLDVADEIASEYGDVIDDLKEVVELTLEAKKSSKDKAAEEKAAKEKAKADAKKAEEDKKNELAKVQNSFVEAIKAGAQSVMDEYKEEIVALKDSMPDGISFVQKGQGISITVDSDTSRETIGQTIGLLLQKEQNSAFVSRQLQFWVGDLVSVAVDRGVYATARDASKHISDMLLAVHGKSLSPVNIDAYKRMAERTPAEYRNSHVDPTAYLTVSNMKIPRREEKEKTEDYQKRLDAFENDRKEIQSKLASGEITKRKDVLPFVEETLVKHGLAQKKDENIITIGQHLALFFHASIGIEELLGSHEEGLVVYTDGTKLQKVTQEELEEIKHKSYSALINALYATKEVSFKDLVRGHIKKTVKVEVTKDSKGKPVMEDQTTEIKVYPRAFADFSTKETSEKTEGEAQ